MPREEHRVMATELERIAAKLCCEALCEERRAGNPHATFCGSRRRVTASGHPVTGRGAEVVGTSLLSHKRSFSASRFNTFPICPTNP